MSEAAADQLSPDPSNDENEEPDRKPATIIRGPNGTARGVTVVLTPEDLRKLGLPLHEVDTVVPRVYNGALLIEQVN